MYYKHCKTKISEARATSNHLQRQLGELSGKGGTSHIVLFVVFILVFVAMTGILAAIAIPAYQDYTMRARVSQAVGESNKLAARVAEFYAQHEQVPATPGEAGFNDPLPASIKSIAIGRGGIITTTMTTPTIQNKSFALVPALDADGRIVWTCSSRDIPSKYLPPQCRPK
jgi:Tfp pilus assembly protein PilE